MEEKELCLEDYITQLELIIEKLEKGDMPFDESVELYKKGSETHKKIEQMLDSLEGEIKVLVNDGQDTVDFDEED